MEIAGRDLITPRVQAFLEAFAPFHEHGVLPEAGGLGDQPATFVEAAHQLNGMVGRLRREQIERE